MIYTDQQSIGIVGEGVSHICVQKLFDVKTHDCISQHECRIAGRVKLGATCIDKCPDSMYEANMECFNECPLNLGYAVINQSHKCQRCEVYEVATTKGCAWNCWVDNQYDRGCYAECPSGTQYQPHENLCVKPTRDTAQTDCMNDTMYYAVYSNTSFIMTTEQCVGFKPPGLYQEIYLNIQDKNLTNIYVANCTGQILLNNSCALENVFQANCVDAAKMQPKQPVLHDVTNKKCVLTCPPPYINQSF